MEMMGLIEDETTRLLIAPAGYQGLAKSEIQGLVWESYDRDKSEIKVTSGIVNGKRGEPKTEDRKEPIPLLSQVRDMLDLYRLRLGNPSTGVMFATKAGTPPSLHNIFTRKIGPILNACAECRKTRKKHRLADHEFRRRQDLVEWHGWHAFRRGTASNLYELGIPDLTIQRILRHGNVNTTRKSYIKHRDDVRAGMDLYSEEIRRRQTMQAEAANQKEKSQKEARVN
jgi:integrase